MSALDKLVTVGQRDIATYKYFYISPEVSCVPISPCVSVFAYEMTSENLIREINPPG